MSLTLEQRIERCERVLFKEKKQRPKKRKPIGVSKQFINKHFRVKSKK